MYKNKQNYANIPRPTRPTLLNSHCSNTTIYPIHTCKLFKYYNICMLQEITSWIQKCCTYQITFQLIYKRKNIFFSYFGFSWSHIKKRKKYQYDHIFGLQIWQTSIYKKIKLTLTDFPFFKTRGAPIRY